MSQFEQVMLNGKLTLTENIGLEITVYKPVFHYQRVRRRLDDPGTLQYTILGTTNREIGFLSYRSDFTVARFSNLCFIFEHISFPELGAPKHVFMAVSKIFSRDSLRVLADYTCLNLYFTTSGFI